MEKIRPILNGVSDYAELRKANAWFVDHTAKIRDLEATRFANNHRIVLAFHGGNCILCEEVQP